MGVPPRDMLVPSLKPAVAEGQSVGADSASRQPRRQAIGRWS